MRWREGRCEAFRLKQRAGVDQNEWLRAASLLRRLKASPVSVSTFLPIAALCTCAASTAVVVHLCVQWGACELQLVDSALRDWVCTRTRITRNAFNKAYDAIVPQLDGGDVRAWGPSSFEYLYEARDQLSMQQLVMAVRCCLVRSKAWSDKPASVVAAEIIQDSSATGFAGNLVTLLLQKPGNDSAKQCHKRVRPPVEYEIQRVEWVKRGRSGDG